MVSHTLIHTTQHNFFSHLLCLRNMQFRVGILERALATFEVTMYAKREERFLTLNVLDHYAETFKAI